jgi:hypothetical protein
MTAYQLNNLIKIGAADRVRAYLKKLSLKERLPLLHELIPYIKDSQLSIKFFHENFSQEIGALIKGNYDYIGAEKIYNQAKRQVTR